MTKKELKDFHEKLNSLFSYREQLDFILKTFPQHYNSIISGKQYKNLYNWICEQVPKLKDPKFCLKTKIFWIINRFHDFPKCKLCGKPFTYNVKLTIGYPTYCKKCNNSIYSDRTKKTKETCLKKYGSYTNFGTNEFKKQVIETNLKKYGCENCMQSDIVKANFKKSIFEKYKTDSVMKLQSTIDKIHLKKQLKIIEIIKNNQNFKPLFDLKTVENFQCNKKSFWWQCMKCEHVFNAPIKSYKKITVCPFCKIEHTHTIGNHSQYESEITNFLKKTFPKLKIFNKNNKINRHVIYPYELDIWIPEKKIAVEFNGVYWHSMQFAKQHNLNKKLHLLNKTNICEKHGIHLIHIYEDDWIYRKQEQKKLIVDLINGKTNISKNNDIIELPHDKYPTFWKIEHYDFISTTQPIEVFHSKSCQGKHEKKNFYSLYDCGNLIFRKK